LAEQNYASATTSPPGGLLRHWAWLPILLFPAALAILFFFAPAGSYEQPQLLLALNLEFSLTVSVFIACLLARSFVSRGAPGLLLLGCGAIVWGAAGLTGVAAGLAGTPRLDFANVAITIHNGCAWGSALCCLAGAVMTARPSRALREPGLWLAAGYAGALGAVGLITLAALAEWTPVFFVAGRGGTPLRQFVLGSAIVMFGITAGLLGAIGRRSASSFASWYAMALALIAVGLVGVLIETTHGGLLGWTGRAAQVLSGVYMLVAAIVSVRETRGWAVPLEAALNAAEQQYRTLVDVSPDAIAVHADGKFVFVNSAAVRLFGASCAEDVVGCEVLRLVHPDDRAAMAERERAVARHGVIAPVRQFRMLRLDGQPVDVEATGARIEFRGRPAAQVVLRDITERKRAEAKIEGASRLLDALMESVPEGITIADAPDVTIRLVSRYGQTAMGAPHAGMTAEQMAARWKVFHADGVTPMRDEELPLVRAVRQGETVRNQEIVQLNSLGVALHLSCNAAPICDRNGRLTGGVVAWRDMSELKKAERAVGLVNAELAERVADLEAANAEVHAARRAALNLMEDALRAGRRAEELNDHLREEIERRRQIQEALRASQEELRRKASQVALANRILQTFVAERDEVMYEMTLEAVLEATGSKYGVFGFIDEDGALVCPTMSKLLADCEVADKCIRYPREKWTGLWSRALQEKRALCAQTPPAVPAGHIPITRNMAVPILFQGQAIGLWNLANKATDYTEEDRKFIEGVADRVGPVLYAWLQRKMRDDERKQAQEALQAAKEAAEAANLAKSQFLANTSHELRTPMNAIMGMTELALREELSPTLRDYLQTAKQSADSLLELLNDVLDLSRIEAGGFQLELTPFDLRKTVEQVIATLGMRAAEKGLKLACDLEQAPERVVGDPLRLRQVLMNLVANAIKFTSQGSVSVHVTVQAEDPQEIVLQFAVADTGIGIAAEDQQRIFAPFTQSDASITRRYGGTGLGLTIAQRIVSFMGGRIWVESEREKGSIFRFTARLGRPAARQVEPCPSAVGGAALGSQTDSARPAISAVPARLLRVLLAEDTPANQKLVTYVLRERGHYIEVAQDGLQALEAIGRQDFDAVLMDVQMPVMDGFLATRAIRDLADPKKARLPIIAMTAHALKGDAERCLAAGMDGYISKPIKGDELIALIERLADSLAVSPTASVGADARCGPHVS